MLKRILIIPIVLLVLGIAFAVISLLVNITRSNSKLIKKKLVIGGLIISLTALLNGPVWAQQGPDVLCYDMAAPIPTIEIFNVQNQGEIIIELPYDSIISGRIQENSGQYYSFKITDMVGQVVQSGELVPSDGAFDQKTEEFEMAIDINLAPGKYNLYFYECDIETLQLNTDIAFFCAFALLVADFEAMCYDIQIID